MRADVDKIVAVIGALGKYFLLRRVKQVNELTEAADSHGRESVVRDHETPEAACEDNGQLLDVRLWWKPQSHAAEANAGRAGCGGDAAFAVSVLCKIRLVLPIQQTVSRRERKTALTVTQLNISTCNLHFLSSLHLILSGVSIQ